MDNHFKMNYLLNSLYGKARTFIKQYEISREPYLIIIGHLKATYGNKQAVINHLLSRIHRAQANSERLEDQEGEINMYGFRIEHLMAFLKECLSCSIFRWSGKYYTQIRGLAMGQRLAPSLVIAFMSKVEAPVTDLGPLLYCRYVDDCFVLCSTQEEMDRCFELLNAQSEYVKFTREKP
ncbi:unnamed protein product [Angiostrongylus costaricensis]|uniref:Reverse transcriptase domain-containing protein n=1 Tax=Angiostrongylus costaricensis TaxID=334426 RepID=A0A0R3PUH6_ANGCS|nr:unnamed protein product [Angiostrongylus costaricensis]